MMKIMSAKKKMPWILKLVIFLVIFCPIMIVARNLMGIEVTGDSASYPFIFFMIIWMGASYHEKFVVGSIKNADRR